MKTFNEFASAIAEQEDGKSHVKIGDIREILKIIITILKTNKLARKWFFSQIRITGECVEAEQKERPVKINKKAVKK